MGKSNQINSADNLKNDYQFNKLVAALVNFSYNGEHYSTRFIEKFENEDEGETYTIYQVMTADKTLIGYVRFTCIMDSYDSESHDGYHDWVEKKEKVITVWE